MRQQMVLLLTAGCSLTPGSSTGKYDFVNVWLEIEDAPTILEEYEGACGQFKDNGIAELIAEGEPEYFGYCVDKDLLLQMEEVTLQVTSDNGIRWDAIAVWGALSSEGLLVAGCDDERDLEPMTLTEAQPLLACP